MLDGSKKEILAFRARLVTAARGRRSLRKPRREPAPLAIASQYAAELVALLDGLTQEIRAIVHRDLRELARVAPLPRADSVRIDGRADEIVRRTILDITVAIARRSVDRQVAEIAGRHGAAVDASNRAAVSRQFRSVLGVDFPSGGEHHGAQLDLFRSNNVALVRGLVDEQRRRVEATLLRTARTGARVEEIAADVQRDLGIGASRANLIARDQVLKLNGELTELRHREAGVEEYEWSTSRDERVRGNPAGLYPDTRDDHFRLEGTRHLWDDPPVVDTRTGRKAHPGQDYQCRCVAVPIIRTP